MKLKNVIWYTIILCLMIAFGSSVTFQAITNRSLFQTVQSAVFPPESEDLPLAGQCTTKPPIDLSQTQEPHLRKLAEYQQVCQSFVTDRLMIFTEMPNSDVKAVEMADKMAATLNEFDRYGITPVVIVEPNTAWGLIDFLEFKSGFYDDWIETYFRQLKRQGVNTSQLGIWVPFPEANIPTWNKGNATPQDYGMVVNQYIALMKRYYPNSRHSLLLNSATYDNTDFDWAYGEYISLMPYVEKVTPGSVESFGLQGFPWMPRKQSISNPLIKPAEYLNYLLAHEAAQQLQVKEIWFNTGTFAAKYTNQPEQQVGMDYLTRKHVLDQVIDQAVKLQQRGYVVWINLFAEDKSNTAEATDWSYWHDPTENQQNQAVFKHFVRQLNQHQIGLSLFDRLPSDSATQSAQPQT